jgi:hypothetical protein
MEYFGEVERTAAERGLSLREAMRMLAGADVDANGESDPSEADWARVVAGPWLAEALKGLRSPEGLAGIDPGSALNGTLRLFLPKTRSQ